MGLCTINAPCRQGATGFLNNVGKIHLNTIDIASGNRQASDSGRLPGRSGAERIARILVQVGTPSHLSGWTQEPADFSGNDKEPISRVPDREDRPAAVDDQECGCDADDPQHPSDQGDGPGRGGLSGETVFLGRTQPESSCDFPRRRCMRFCNSRSRKCPGTRCPPRFLGSPGDVRKPPFVAFCWTNSHRDGNIRAGAR